MTAAQIARLTRSLVAIKARKKSDNGSGFVVGHGPDHTLLLTANHVVARRRVGAITRRVGRKFIGHRFEIIKRDKKKDLALLKTERFDIPAIKLSDKAPHVYDRAIIVGCPARTVCPGPEAYFGTVAECLISGMDGSNGDRDLDYQLSVPIGGGMSGGMLLNEAGELIGVATAGDDGAFISFATPLSTVREFLAQGIAQQ